MSDIALNESDWDLQITGGDLVLLSPLETVRQFLRQRLSLFLGEWFLDASLGVPYIQSIFIAGAQLAAIDTVFKKVILETPGVIELSSFLMDYDPQTRTFDLSFEALTSEGVIQFDEEIGV